MTWRAVVDAGTCNCTDCNDVRALLLCDCTGCQIVKRKHRRPQALTASEFTLLRLTCDEPCCYVCDYVRHSAR